MARARGEGSEMDNATGQMTPLPRAASSVYFNLFDDGDVLAARPTPLVEVRPQLGVLRHTAAHFEDIVPFVQIHDVPVPQLGDRVVDLLREIDAPRPRSLWTGSRSAPCVVVHGELNSWWKCIRSYLIPHYSNGLPSRPSTFQFFMVEAIVAAGEVYKVCAQDRIQHRLWSRTLTFRFLMVVVDGSVMEAFKVSLRDRVQQRFEEQITLTLQFLRVVAALEVLKVPPEFFILALAWCLG